MADLMLESSANGTWEYEIEEKKVKVKYKIKKGLNEIPESHLERLESDAGYQARVKKGIYKILKGGKAITAKKADEKPVEDAKDLDSLKDAGKAVISDLKKKHVEELKTKNDEFTAEYQKLTDSRGEALRKVKELEEVNLKLTGEIAAAKGGTDADKDILKTEITDLKKDHESELLSLKTENEKAVKSLEGAKESLEKKVKDQASEIKILKAKKA